MPTDIKTLPWTRNGLRYFTNDVGEEVCTGAQMGRRDNIPNDYATVRKLHLRLVPLVDGGCYDKSGAYWGSNRRTASSLYCAWGESDTEQVEVYFRARDRYDARMQARAAFPSTTFYR